MKLLFATLAVLAAASAHAQSLAPDMLFARAAPNVWVVQAGDAQGKLLATGNAVALGPGKAVTRCSLLAKASTVTLRRDNVSYGATLEFPDTERDLCQLRIANFDAPPLSVAPAETLRVGMTLYTIGTPDGRDLTLGVGMLSALRRNAAGELEALQLPAAPEAGLAGAALFDAQGRLAGFVGAPPTALATPAAWVVDLPGRGRQAIATMGSQPRAAARFSVVEYTLRDRLTNLTRPVVYRVDPRQGDTVSFNNGTWVEKPGGEVVSASASIGGEFDAAMPPGGWARPDVKPGASWSANYKAQSGAGQVAMDLQATVKEASSLPVNGKQVAVVRIEYRGYTQRSSMSTALVGNQSGAYRADVWYAPELGRVVRFEAKTRGGISGGAFQIDESLELVAIR